jgi:hypothetical protein
MRAQPQIRLPALADDEPGRQAPRRAGEQLHPPSLGAGLGIHGSNDHRRRRGNGEWAADERG